MMRIFFTVALMVWLQNPLFAQQAELTSFSIDLHEEEVIVRWTVGAGYTCNIVSIERSIDSLTYETLHVYPGVCGASAYDESYSWIDSNPVGNAKNFYRLNLGALGKTPGLSVYVVNYGDDGLLAVPMPIQENVVLYFTNPDSRRHRFELSDVVGRTIYIKEDIHGTQFDFQANALATGLYVLRLSDESGRVRTSRWIVQ